MEGYLHGLSQANYNPELPVDEQTECLTYDDKWEFPPEHLKFGWYSLTYTQYQASLA